MKMSDKKVIKDEHPNIIVADEFVRNYEPDISLR